MKFEYLPAGVAECPLVRIYGESKNDFIKLLKGIDKLMSNKRSSVMLNDELGIVTVKGMSITFELAEDEPGGTPIFLLKDNQFTLCQSAAQWRHLYYNIEPLIHNDGFYWLSTQSEIKILFSRVEHGFT